MAIIKCFECGNDVSEKAATCPNCGVAINKKQAKNRTIAGLLALFLGGLGFHKFYLEKTGQGLLYLVFCWTFIPAFIGFVEGLNYLLMSNKLFAVRYCGMSKGKEVSWP